MKSSTSLVEVFPRKSLVLANRGRRKGRRDGRESIPRPPALNHQSFQILNYRMRFYANAAFNGSIRFVDILNTRIIATTGTVAAQHYIGVRLKRVQCWSVPAVGFAAPPANLNTIEVWFNSGSAETGDQQVFSDTSMGIEPAYLDCKPSAKSDVALWQIQSTNVAMALVLPAGAIIDLVVDFRGYPGGGQAATNAGVGMTAGSEYGRGLDGLAFASTVLPPIYPAIA